VLQLQDDKDEKDTRKDLEKKDEVKNYFFSSSTQKIDHSFYRLQNPKLIERI